MDHSATGRARLGTVDLKSAETMNIGHLATVRQDMDHSTTG
jgi:hypothetical protein